VAGSTEPSAVSSEAPKPDPQEEVVARVNGEALYVQDVASVLEAIHQGAQARSRSDFDVDQMLFRLINDTLLTQEARALGIDSDPSVQRRLDRRRQELARARLEREEIKSRVQFDPAELQRFYEEIFRTATLRILTRSSQAEAEALRQEVESSEDLAALAREKSEDPYSPRGGLVQSMPKIDLPQSVAEAVFSSEPGQIGGPVATAFGWTVFRVEALEPADPEQYEPRIPEVRAALRFQQEEALRTELLVRLRQKHPVVVHTEVYDSIEPQTLPDGRLVPRIDNPKAILVEAGGRPITVAEYGQALSNRWDGISNPEVAIAIKPILLDRLTVDELLAVEALDRGYGDTPEVEREIHALETRILVQKYLKEVISPQVEITQEESEQYFESHRDEFRKPPRLYISQLTVETEAEAEDLAEKVRAGTEFAWLARQHSIDGFRESGGDRGWVLANRGVDGFVEELANAAPGDILGPKPGPSGWRLLRVNALEEQGFYTFQEVSGNVRVRLEERRFLELVDTYIQRLRERSEIWINDEVITSLGVKASPASASEEDRGPGHGGR
jgi:parvulin-like peptidyl-prolyl isomerase